MARRHKIEVFSLSFLDCISCGFGAVVLLFVIINGQVSARARQAGDEVLGETSRIEEEVLQGRKDLLRLRNSVKEQRETRELLAAEARRAEETLRKLREEAAGREGETVARRESVEQLRADIRQLEEANRRLSERLAEPKPATGQRLRSVTGEGQRQYLTGIRMGGKRVAIVVDASASMLGRNFVNIVRFRSMPDDRKVRAPKWRQAVATVDWLTSQITPGTQVQILAFNEKVWSLLDVPPGQWVTVADGAVLDRAVAALRKVVPRKGSSLFHGLAAVGALKPAPDNLFLITDGLPTQSEIAPDPPADVRPDQRAQFFRKAISEIPLSVPLTVFLLPMDGDPEAAGLYWEAAIRHRGTLLTPTEDWP